MISFPLFTRGRRAVDLNGTWKFCPDPMQRARHQTWWRRTSRKDWPWPCWDVEGLWDIKVPGTWKTQFEELKWYDGHATYLLDFDVDEIPAGSEAFLCFDGVVYSAEIYLNGQFMGRHDWGYSPFSVRVTDVLGRANRLWVLVENNYSKDRVPGEIFDWNNDGGIINPVRLVFVPRVHIENFRVWTRLEGKDACVQIEIFLGGRDASASREVKVRMGELGLEDDVCVEVGKPAAVEFRVPAKSLTLWSPSSPKLYKIELSTADETICDEVGLREIRADGARILLNGKPLRLYGICVHSDFKGTGRTATTEGARMMIKAAKELGLNFLRCAHYPYSETFGRAMDRAGIMWWEEVPAYWLRNISQEGQTRLALGMLNDAIRRDWNRASIIIWSVSNECCHLNPDDPGDNNLQYWFEAVGLVRRLDPTRLVSCAESQNVIQPAPAWSPGRGDEFKRSTDQASSWRPAFPDEWYELFDVLAANFYVQLGEAKATYARYAELFRPYNKPLMLSEFGSVSLRGAKAPAGEIGSPARHARSLTESYEALMDLPEIVGACPWCLVDIRVPIHWRWYNRRKAVFRYGMLDENWRKKEVFPVLKRLVGALKRKFRCEL